jgi:hypothetical protein
MTEGFDDVCATIPFIRFFWVRLEVTRMEIKCVPHCHERAPIQRPDKLCRFIFLPYRVNGEQKCPDRLHIGAAYPGEPRVWKGGVEMMAFIVDTFMHGVIEILSRPCTDSSFLVGSDVS